MIFNGPIPPAGPYQQFFQQVLDTLRKSFLSVVSKDEASPRVLLLAPNGQVYSVTVDNSGTLQTELNDGKSRI
ncbi:hypothetical protein UFOVP155_21 [uncultured Caudovirales phage]|uniref:Uncharacterized protein n=1 Tax=uncultured Caudovirales phage TaxID=2100421 RepID=A0A6J7WDZ1_9CAUD|nr:hypothetical protein UFOVP155_21 [uncultured Caudovirales phage]